MSSTNRSDARKEHKSDYYVTPQYAIRDFIVEFLLHENIRKDIEILDPCAGGDENHKMSYPSVLNEFGFNDITTIDIREDSLAGFKGNYLMDEIKNLQNKFDLIITNPPFNNSIEIIKKAIRDVKNGGYVVMLQRLNFMGGVTEKKKFWEEVGLPKYIFVHRKRMSFTDDGQTDSIEYAHYVWQKGYNSDFAKTKIIGGLASPKS